MSAVNRFEDRAHVAAFCTGRDGVISAVDGGVTFSQMPEGDGELEFAWGVLQEAYRTADRAADVVRGLLEGRVKPRYVVKEQPPSELAKSYGMDYTLYIVWDTVMERRVPFSGYRTPEKAHARIHRILEREVA